MKPQTEHAIQLARKNKRASAEQVWSEIIQRIGVKESGEVARYIETNGGTNPDRAPNEEQAWAHRMLQFWKHHCDWADAGFPLVTVTEADAAELANTDPASWLLTSPSGNDPYAVLGVEFGEHFVIVVDWRNGACVSVRDPAEKYERFPFDHTARKRFIANVGFALLERPEGLEIREHRPSAKAMRKQGRKHYPTVQYIIQAARDLQPTPPGEERGHREEGWTQSVRTSVRGHWRRQPYGPGNSLVKVIWIRPFWRGPEDAPVSIHPIRLFKLGAT